MVEINDTPMVNSANLAKVVTTPRLIESLLRQESGISGKHRSLGIGLAKSTSMSRTGGNDGIDISRDAVQGWLDEGKLTLRDEPTTAHMQRIYGSPAEFLEANGLTDPRKK